MADLINKQCIYLVNWKNKPECCDRIS